MTTSTQETTSHGYAGDQTSEEAWRTLQADPTAVLLDVRTRAEWQYVGVPSLEPIGKQAAFVEWQTYPDGAISPDFVDAVRATGIDPRATVLVICRSGQRSRSAAIALTGGGFAKCINVSDGFEGPLDAERKRGRASGWKAAGLPWAQN